MFELKLMMKYNNYSHLLYLKIFNVEIISITKGKDLGLQLLNKRIF